MDFLFLFNRFTSTNSTCESIRKIHKVQKLHPRIIFDDYDSNYDVLLRKSGKVTMKTKWLRFLAIGILKESIIFIQSIWNIYIHTKPTSYDKTEWHPGTYFAWHLEFSVLFHKWYISSLHLKVFILSFRLPACWRSIYFIPVFTVDTTSFALFAIVSTNCSDKRYCFELSSLFSLIRVF